jgi:CheY-like chemotaxis protein
LLAEDNRVNQKLAARMLEQMGHQVTVAENGKVAVEQLQKGDGFDLVLMDVHMPEMDGYAATQTIRAWEKQQGSGKHLPIIAMTANAMAGDRDKCLRHGMDGYVAKPISWDDLERAVEQVSSYAWNKIPESPATVAVSDAEVGSIG